MMLMNNGFGYAQAVQAAASLEHTQTPPSAPLPPHTQTNTLPNPPPQVINATLDELIAKCKQLVEEEDEEFSEEFLSEKDPSILHFLLASGE